MAHSSGSASTPIDLLQQFVAWLQTLGWTVQASLAEGSGWRAHLSKNGVYVNLRAGMNEALGQGYYYGSSPGYGLGMNVSTGYNAALDWHTQPGCPLQAGSTTIGLAVTLKTGAAGTPGPLTRFHFLADEADNVALVLEGAPTVYSHLGWGPSLIKAGVWSLGQYFFGSRSPCLGFSGTAPDGYTSSSLCPFTDSGDACGQPTAFVRVDVDTAEGGWLAVSRAKFYSQDGTPRVPHLTKFLASPVLNPSTSAGYPPEEIPRYGTAQFASRFQARQFTAFNSQIHMLPVLVYVARDAGGYSLLGRVPNIYYCAATDHDVPAGSVLSLGPDSYRVFPNFCIRQVD